MDSQVFDTTAVIESDYTHYIIFFCSIFGVAWGSYNASLVNKI